VSGVGHVGVVGRGGGGCEVSQSHPGAVSGLLTAAQTLVELCYELVRTRPPHELLPLHVPTQRVPGFALP